MARKKAKARQQAAPLSVDEMKMCKLNKEGLMEEVDKRSASPTAVCNRCRSKASAARDLCQPRVL